MNFPKRSLTATVVTLSLIGLVGNFQLSQATAAYTEVTLGSAGNYMILAGTAITNGAGTHLDGDASLASGISPTLAGAGIADSLIASGSSRFDDGGDTATAAQIDLGRAIEFIESLTVTTSRPVIANETFTAGVYGTESGVALSIGGVITLDGGGDSQSVFIFRTGSALDFLATTSIILTGGSQPANVYWVAGSALTMGAASTVSGNVMALSALTIGASSILTGALLTQGAITIGAGTSLTHKALIPIVIVVPPVVVPPAPEPIIIAPDQPPVIFPTITPEPTPTPTPTPEPIVEVTVPPEPIIVATPTPTPTPEITILPVVTAPPTPSAEPTNLTPQTSPSPTSTAITQVTPTPVPETQTPVAITPEVPISTSITRESFSPYSPIDHPRDTAKTAIEAFAVLALVTSGAATTQGFLAQVARGGVLAAGVHLGRGDRRRARKSKSYGKPINFFTSFATAISSASPLAARTVSDASYLRASLGSLSLFLYPASIALGAFAAVRVNFQSLPPSMYFVIAMMALGIADAMAGLIAGIVFSIAIAAHGNVSDLKSLLTLAGVVLLAFSPGILAGTFRPLRRYVDNFRALWERSTDYIIASILAGWVVKQIAVGLPGLSGLDLPIATHANELGIVAGLLVALRFAAEDSVSYFLPGRIRDLEPEYEERNLTQKLMTGAVQVAVFAVVAQPFIGWNIELWLGLAIFVTPMVLALVSEYLPKSSLIRKWLPTGVIEIILIALSGYFITQILVNQNYPATKFILIAFVLLSLPGLLIKLFQIFAGDYEHHWRDSKKGYFTYEIAGLAALATLIYIVFVGF